MQVLNRVSQSGSAVGRAGQINRLTPLLYTGSVA